MSNYTNSNQHHIVKAQRHYLIFHMKNTAKFRLFHLKALFPLYVLKLHLLLEYMQSSCLDLIHLFRNNI